MPTITKDLRGRFLAARDQGGRPTCLAFALSDLHAAHRTPLASLSAEFLFFHTVRRTPGQRFDQGLVAPIAAESLRHDGQPLETVWPYSPVWPRTLTPVTPPATTAVWRAASDNQSASVQTIRDLLDRDRPSVIIMSLTESFFSPAADGILRLRYPDPHIPGWHAVVAVGYDNAPGRNHILIRNSWGQAWGAAGHAWLDESYLSPKLSSVTALSPLP